MPGATRGSGPPNPPLTGDVFDPAGVPLLTGADDRLGAKRDADRTRGAELLRAAHLVGGQLSSFVDAAELRHRKSRS